MAYVVTYPPGGAAASVSNAQLANMAQATAKGRARGAGTGSPQDLTPAQVGALARFAGSEVLSLAPGTHDNVAIAEGTTIVYVSPTSAGDVDITGFIQGTSNAGSSLWVIKPTATGRVRLMHAAGTSSFNNQFLNPGGRTFTLTSVDDTVHVSNEGAGQWRTNGLETRAELLAPETTSRGVPFIIRTSCPASGAAGTADDVEVFNAAAPFGFRILDVTLYTSTAVAAATCTLRSASGGGGSALSSALAVATTGVARNNNTATATVASAGSVFLRRTDRSHVGELVITAVRT